jgi:hypothetical protein
VADGIYVKAGLEKDNAALLVIVAGLRDGRKADLGGAGRSPRVDGGVVEDAARLAAPRSKGCARLLVADGYCGGTKRYSYVIIRSPP